MPDDGADAPGETDAGDSTGPPAPATGAGGGDRTAPIRFPGTTVPLPTPWAVERCCFLLPAAVGAGLLGVLESVLADGPFALAFVLAGSLGYATLSVALAGAVAVDAARLRRSEAPWAPHPAFWSAATLLAAGLAGPAYLALRHRRVGTVAQPGPWWLLVAGLLVLWFPAVVAGVAVTVAGAPEALASATFVVAVAVGGTLPGALYLDAGVVGAAGDWRPNPGVYLGLALAGLVLVVVQPLVAGYYLRKRHRHAGLDLPAALDWRR